MSEQHRLAALARWKGTSREERAAFARQGGQTAHRLGRAHRWTAEEALRQAKLGGRISGHARMSDHQIEETYRAAVRELQVSRKYRLSDIDATARGAYGMETSVALSNTPTPKRGPVSKR